MNLQDLRTNAAAETAGVWLDFMGARFKLASSAAPAYRLALAKHGRSINQHALRTSPELADKLNREAMADAILLEWQGDVRDGDEPLDHRNREHRLRLLNVRAFAEWVAAECQNLANFQTEDRRELERDLKSGD